MEKKLKQTLFYELFYEQINNAKTLKKVRWSDEDKRFIEEQKKELDGKKRGQIEQAAD